MAEKDNSAGAVFIELGLDISQLESDFINVDQTIQQNLSRLNRENNLIQLRADVEIGNLDKVKDAEKILGISSQALNKQLQIQRDRTKLVSAAHKELANSKGAVAAETQKMEARMNREQLVLQRLEDKLREVTKAQEALKNSSNTREQGKSNNSLLSWYNNVKGDVFGKLGELSSGFSSVEKATSLADGAITKTLETIGKIPAPVAAAVTSLVAIPVAARQIEDSLIDMARPAIEAGDAFYVMSRGLQMSIQETEELERVCKVTGIAINEVITANRRLERQLIEGGKEGKQAKMLAKYGADIWEDNGEIKSGIERDLEIHKALKNAEAAGHGKSFTSTVFGRSVTGDLVTYFEDLGDNVKAAKTIVRNGLFDPEKAHAIQGNINALNDQAEQLGSTFSSALMPVADVLVPRLTERLGKLTNVVCDNASGIKTIASSVATVVEKVADLTVGIAELTAKVVGTLGNMFNFSGESFIKQHEKELQNIKNEYDVLELKMQSMSKAQQDWIKNNPNVYYSMLAGAKETF